MYYKKLFTVFWVIFFCRVAMAQNNFKGIVSAAENDMPLTGVTISVANKPVAISDSAGVFQFNDSNDKVNISFSYIGYITYSGYYTTAQKIEVSLSPNSSFLSIATVKAFERNATIKNIPVTVTVLGKADLERYGNVSLVHAVNTVPGVKMDERSPGSYRLSIRGNLLRSPFGVRNVKVYWNGIPFTDASGNTYLNLLAFNNIGKIEVIKGPGGSLYGSGTGGVLLLNGRTADKNENSISVNAVGGSWGLFETDVAYRKGTDNANYSLSYGHLQSDGWRTHTNMRRDVVNYSGSFKINNREIINTNIFYGDLYYQTPGGLTTTQMNANPRQARPAGGRFKSAEAQQAAIYNKTFYIGFSHSYQFTDAWSNTTSIYTSGTRFSNPSILNYQIKAEQGIGGRSITQYHKNNLAILFGGEYQYGFTSSRTFGNNSGVPDTLQFDDQIGATQYNIFLQADITLPQNFIINAGLSYNNYGYDFTRFNSYPVKEINKIYDPVLIPRISLLKKIGENYRLYATASEGYSPPTIDDIVPSTGIFNPFLKAEQGINYEIGFRGEPIPHILFVDVAVYYFNLNNTIVVRRNAAGSDYFVNTGKTDQRGIELSANYYPVKNSIHFLRELKLWANYTYIDANFVTYQQGINDYAGNKLTGTSPNVFVGGADAITKIGLYANLTYSYTDQIPLNDANTFFATQYNLFFARLGYKKDFSKKLQGEIYFSYDKSFNTPYGLGNDLNGAGNRFFNPSAPENFIGGIQFKLNL